MVWGRLLNEWAAACPFVKLFFHIIWFIFEDISWEHPGKAGKPKGAWRDDYS